MVSKKPPSVKKIWDEYNVTLEKWKDAYQLWQKAGNDALTKYSKACQTTLDSDTDSFKKISEEWQKTWKDAGVEQMTQFAAVWGKMLKASGLEPMKFNQDWEKFWKTSGIEAFKTYAEELKKFTKP